MGPRASTSPSMVRPACRWSMSIDSSMGAYSVSSTVETTVDVEFCGSGGGDCGDAYW